jgi:hypothetical protein
MDGVQPRSIPVQERIWHIALALVLLTYGGVGLYYDDLYVPGKRSRGIHFHGMAAWIMYGAFACAALNLLSVAADRCDTSEGERRYHIFARTTQILGWVLFFGAIVCSLVPVRPRQW